MKKIYLLSFLMVIVGISCEKETVITISNESFEEYFPYHENINGNYYIKNYHYTTDARIFGMNYLEFDSSNGKIGRWVHKK